MQGVAEVRPAGNEDGDEVAGPTFEGAKKHFAEFISRRVLESMKTGEYRLAFPGEYVYEDGKPPKLVSSYSICSLLHVTLQA